MESTRQTILEILRRRKHATVEELTNELGLAAATVRRHLDILMRDNYVSVSQKRRDIGRPHYVFSITDAGDDLFPRRYVRLTNRILDELVSLDNKDTKGKSGVALAGIVFEKMADHVADTYAGQISGKKLADRLDQVIKILAGEGMFFEWRRAEDGYLLLGQGCPCPRIADIHNEVCVHDQRLLSRLLEADVEPVTLGRESENSICAYLVKERAT
jgi:DeoR family transcriptional regulator, suf operon transcriptional repressor